MPFVVAASLLLAACEGTDRRQTGASEPERDSILGPGGVMALLEDEGPQPGAALGVNAYLWRAALDAFAFLPLASADPVGGVIIYDWYSPADSPGERFKIDVVILDTRLRADGVRVAAFRQVLNEDGSWRQAALAEGTPRALEDAVLTRARELRIAHQGR